MKLKYLGLIALLATNSFAGQPVSFTYQGKALNAAGTAPLTSTVTFTLTITDPSSACILYQESQPNVNLATTNGIFALQVGSAVGDTKRVSGVDPGLTMGTIFANAGAQIIPANASCASGYTPATGDVRKLHVVITPTAGSPITVSPDLTINSVPNATVAETLQGQTPNQMTPPGFVMPFVGVACPTGFLATDGSSQLIATYPNLALAEKSGTTYIWGSADSTHFNLPDFRGQFLRGVDPSATIDTQATSRTAKYTGGATGNSVGTFQTQTTAKNGLSDAGHTHTTFIAGATNGNAAGGGGQGIWYNGVSTPQTGVGFANLVGDAETRPVNAAVNYCVKY